MTNSIISATILVQALLAYYSYTITTSPMSNDKQEYAMLHTTTKDIVFV